MWIVLATAHAHVPHDNVLAVAAPSRLPDDLPWFTVVTPDRSQLLLRSEDGGRTWAMIGGEPLMDELAAATSLDDGTVVLLGEDRLWWSGDAGETWSWAALPGDATRMAGAAELWIGGDAVWAGAPGGEMRLELDAEVADLRVGDDVVVAVGSRGRVYLRDEAGWSDLGAPADGTAVAAPGGGRVYAGTAEGAVWRWDGSWTACGALPPPEGGGRPDVVQLAVVDGRVLVAPAWRGPFVSDDGCATWSDGATAELDADFGGEGGAQDAHEAFTALAAAGDRVLLAGWNGLATSEDRGAAWSGASLVPADCTRGLAFGAAFPDVFAIHVGGYAAGVARTGDGGASFEAPASGLVAPNVQRVAAPIGGTDPDELVAVVGHRPHVSRDGGRSWEDLPDPGDDAEDVVAWGGLDELWILQPGEGLPPVVASEDGGATWAEVAGLAEALDGAAPVAASAVGAERCVAAIEPATVACGSGGAWTARYRGAGTSATAPVGWPPDGPTRIVFGDASGVHLLAGSTATDVEVAPDDPAVALAASPGGTLFLATRSGALHRSDDGGTSWLDLGLRVPATVHVLAPRPDFERWPELLVATHDGLFVVAGDASMLSRWGAWQRLDDRSSFLRCSDCGPSESRPRASMDSVRRLREGGVVSADVRGDRVRLVGECAGPCGVEVRVDGTTVASPCASEAPLGTLADVGGLADGWHEVEVTGVTGSCLDIDAIEGIGPSDVLGGAPAAVAGPTGRCGCGGGGALLAFVRLVPRRRRGAG